MVSIGYGWVFEWLAQSHLDASSKDAENRHRVTKYVTMSAPFEHEAGVVDFLS
jgi:hypothetical protein